MKSLVSERALQNLDRREESWCDHIFGIKILDFLGGEHIKRVTDQYMQHLVDLNGLTFCLKLVPEKLKVLKLLSLVHPAWALVVFSRIVVFEHQKGVECV